MLRLFMRILMPSDKILKSSDKGRLIKIQIRLYQSLLRFLSKCYRHYAISDTIVSGEGKLRITHEFRDTAFEAELRRNNIDTAFHKKVQKIPLSFSKSGHSCCFSYFTWKDMLIVNYDDIELVVSHNDQMILKGKKANAKISSPEDIIIGSEVAMVASQQVTGVNKRFEQETSLFKGEKVRKHEPKRINEPETAIVDKPAIEKRGFEIDTTF